MVSIIIVNWNTKEYLKGCLDSILDASGGIPYEIVIVDNASGDGSCSFIKENYIGSTSGVRLIENRRNVGFAVACNRAAEESRGKYLFILNPDTILSKRSLRGLVEFIESHSWIGMVGPKLVDRKGRVQNSVRRFPSLKQALFRDTVLSRIVPWFRRGRLVESLPAENPSKVDQVSGGAFMIKKELWQEIGGMDPRFFMFYEEVDLCRRINEMGYNIFYLPTVEVAHIGGASRHQDPNNVFYHSIKSMFLYFEKYISFRKLFLFKCIYKPLFLAELGLDMIFKYPQKVQFKVRKDFFRKRLLEFVFDI